MLTSIVVAVGAGLYYLLECKCDVPTVTHAPFLALPDASEPVITAPKAPAEWVAVTRQDLAAARRYLEQNSPIPFDYENPQVGQWLVQGYEQGIVRAQQVSDLGGYSATLSAYLNGFHDPHVSFGLDGAPPQGRWPGFIVAQRPGGGEIIDRDENDASLPPVGTKIFSCEGKSLEQLAVERIFPFRFNAKLPPDRRAAITRLFFSRHNPFAPPLVSCDMEIAGRQQSVILNWRDLPKDEDAWTERFRAGSLGPDTDWGVSEPAPGVTWIGVPTFRSGDDTAPKLDALIADVSKRGDSMRNGRAIVIDTRGNRGGNSSWADKLAAAIFTQDVLDKNPAPARQSAVDWRASDENGSYWYEWSAQMEKEFGRFSVNRLGSLLIGRQLTRFAHDNPPVYRTGSCKPSTSGGWSRERPKGASPFPAKVYFLSNGTCGSSCLNFADEVLMVPGVKLIGTSTSADGSLMEVRDGKLPSGLGSISIPQKVERGAGRAPMEYYEADIAYEGVWTDKAVRAWVMEVAAGAD